jgi:hypothetical protein
MPPITTEQRLERLERATAQLYDLHTAFRQVDLRRDGHADLAELVERHGEEKAAAQAALPPAERDVPFGMPAGRR